MKAYKMSKNVLLRNDGKEKLVFNVSNANVFKVNSVGFLILKACQKKIFEDKLLETLKKTFPKEDDKKLNKDMNKFIKKLVGLNLIKVFKNGKIC